ncbi:MAG: ATP phosphoribosyltransferase regulatory subunit [Gammaproteobacteria bacterium]|nr:ATP phosphoribosyltransferase regulatory subunit [Gammaproteobacteria bacterium]
MTGGWIQLDGVEQILPYDGWEFEQLRRELLDCLYQNGYELVVPPLADFVECLLGGTNDDLDVLTVKTPDYVSGKMFGIRADMTPQVARLAALHLPVQEQPVRLCYFGSSLLARVPSIGGSRELLQFGAELFGSSSLESDCEIIRLMIESLRIAGIDSLSVSLGHVGIIESLFEQFGYKESSLENALLDALKRKSKPELDALADREGLQAEAIEIFSNLIELNGGIDILDEAENRLKSVGNNVPQLLSEFERVVRRVAEENNGVSLHVDFAQVGGYQYHTGVIFSAYGPGYGQPLAKGGRYDSVMAVYGTPCAATGFSGDLRLLRRAIRGECKKAVMVPLDSNVPREQIDALIERGDRVIHQLPDQTRASLIHTCDREFVCHAGEWRVVPLTIEGEV